MPFIYDMTKVEWPDDDGPPPPKVSDFVYMSVQDFGIGGRDPSPLESPDDEAVGRSSGIADRVRSWLGRPPAPDPWREERLRAERASSALIAEVRRLGARRIYGRYDGGNDEGFAWLDRVEFANGETLSAKQTAERLRDSGAQSRLIEAGFITQIENYSAHQQFDDIIRYSLVEDWATRLLGRGFGTGEYYLYGAFTADLEAGTLTDDRRAEAIVENIEIDRGKA